MPGSSSHRSSRSAIDLRKWFDRMQPQTMQIATWLLYINGAFALINLIDGSNWIGFARESKGLIGLLVAGAVVVANAGGGLLMANDRRLGYRLAIVAAFSPFALRIWLSLDWDGYGFVDRITGNDTIGFIFEVALCALLLHPNSREHQRLWFS